jgi:hypothetical protein
MAEKAIRKLIKRQEHSLILVSDLGHGVPNASSILPRRALTA